MKGDQKKSGSLPNWIEFLRERNPLPIIGFLIPIAHLISVKGLERRILFVFVFPSLFAIALLNKTENRKAIYGAYSFLLLITIGVVIGPYPILFPKLNGCCSDLPPQHARSLTWYLLCYMLYLVGVAPLLWFNDNLRRHKLGEQTELTRFTCRLGLFALFVIGLPMIVMVFSSSGIWPLYDMP